MSTEFSKRARTRGSFLIWTTSGGARTRPIGWRWFVQLRMPYDERLNYFYWLVSRINVIHDIYRFREMYTRNIRNLCIVIRKLLEQPPPLRVQRMYSDDLGDHQRNLLLTHTHTQIYFELVFFYFPSKKDVWQRETLWRITFFKRKYSITIFIWKLKDILCIDIIL